MEKISLKIALYTAICVGLLSVKNAELLGYAPICRTLGIRNRPRRHESRRRIAKTEKRGSLRGKPPR